MHIHLSVRALRPRNETLRWGHSLRYLTYHYLIPNTYQTTPTPRPYLLPVNRTSGPVRREVGQCHKVESVGSMAPRPSEKSQLKRGRVCLNSCNLSSQDTLIRANICHFSPLQARGRTTRRNHAGLSEYLRRPRRHRSRSTRISLRH